MFSIFLFIYLGLAFLGYKAVFQVATSLYILASKNVHISLCPPNAVLLSVFLITAILVHVKWYLTVVLCL